MRIVWFMYPVTLGTMASDGFALVAQIGRGDFGVVHEAVTDTGDRVAIKCGPRARRGAFSEEFECMKHLQSAEWSVKPFKIFDHGDDVCIAMELLGQDLESRRKSSAYGWPMETIASIGVSLVVALKELHFKYGFVHVDLHIGNMATRAGNDGQLVILDYGRAMVSDARYMRSVDLRRVLIALVFFWTGDVDLYTNLYQDYDKFRPALAQVAPAELVDVVDFLVWARSNQTPLTPDDYDIVKEALEEIVLRETGQAHDGNIVWRHKQQVI